MRSFTLISTFYTLALVHAATISKNARCGASFAGATCLGSSWGSCCSKYNFCGSTDAYCPTEQGCQTGFGTCAGQSTGEKPKVLAVSKNGNCGEKSGQTCINSVFGNCCSQYGYCGSSNSYCAQSRGCQSKYGKCDATSTASGATSTPQSSSPVAPTKQLVSTDARCGAGFSGQTCKGGFLFKKNVCIRASADKDP
jgi:hypothetical protein